MHAKRLDGNGEFAFRNYLNKSAFKALSIKLFSISVIVNMCARYQAVLYLERMLFVLFQCPVRGCIVDPV